MNNTKETHERVDAYLGDDQVGVSIAVSAFVFLKELTESLLVACMKGIHCLFAGRSLAHLLNSKR